MSDDREILAWKYIVSVLLAERGGHVIVQRAGWDNLMEGKELLLDKVDEDHISISLEDKNDPEPDGS